MIDMPAVIIIFMPLSIWYTLAATIVKAIFINVDAIISKQAGIASINGLISDLFATFCPRSILVLVVSTPISKFKGVYFE